MKRSLFLFSLLCLVCSVKAVDTIFIKEAQLPILIERKDNALFYLRMDSKGSQQLNEIVLQFDKEVNLSEIKSVKLYYGGTEAVQKNSTKRFFPVDYLTPFIPNKTLSAIPSYSSLKNKVVVNSNTIRLIANQKLFSGENYFWISIEMKPKTSLFSKIGANITSVLVDNKPAQMKIVSSRNIEHRIGVGVRHAGDDGVSAYRIPGLVTTKKSTLLAIYDVRYNNSVDLQEHIDVGLSRSTNGGKTWEKMRLPLSFDEVDGLPLAQNGVGDAAILVDDKTNTIWIAATWAHGMGNQRSWVSSQPGMNKDRTSQLVLTKSIDDGKTWSKPINITQQLKNPSWHLFFQAPGRGITMNNGTLVFSCQFIDSTGLPHATIMYSQDGGNTWHIHNPARSNTTESQVVEIEPNVLMLNMRDNRGGSRAVAITKNMGKTWEEHESSRKLLPEPICMASLINIKAQDNIFNQDLLIFSNPNTSHKRNHITIKISLDKGKTWLPKHQLLLDEGDNWGYSCLTMIDKETIGILYESSVAQMTFQAIKLKDILKK